MRNEQVLIEFVNGATKGSNSGKNLRIEGDRLVNYGTCLCQRVNDSSFILNDTKYSSTTSTHQNKLRRMLPRFEEVTNIPMGTNDLLEYV